MQEGELGMQLEVLLNMRQVSIPRIILLFAIICLVIFTFCLPLTSLNTIQCVQWFINESYCEPQKVSHVTELYNMPSQKASSSSRYVKQISGHHRSQKASRMHLCSKLLGLKQITKAKLAAAEQMQQKQLCMYIHPDLD